MKKSITKVLVRKNASASLLLVFGIFFLVGFACNSGSKPVASEYVGAWTGGDGSTMTIRPDATGDYKSGGTTVTGGAVEINDKDNTLSITFVGMGPKFKIDKAPSGNQMTLDGVVYRKGGSLDSKSTSTSSDDRSSGDVPSDSKLQSLARTTVLDFNDAVQSGDFSDFHDTVSKPFQKQASAEKMKDVFRAFIDAKVNFKEVKSLDAKFTSTPLAETNLGYKTLTLKGNYATTPRKTNFELKYIYEDDEWKLSSIEINTKDQ